MRFESIAEVRTIYGTSIYADSKNNKIYVSVKDFFDNLKDTTKEAKISVNTKKKSVKINIGKKYKEKDNYVDLLKSIYGNPENIKLDIDGKKTEIKGYLVKSDSYWSKGEALYLDFDELAKKLDLVYDKDIAKKKYLMYTKLPENVVELKSGKLLIESCATNANTAIGSYDINGRWASQIKNYLYEEGGKLVRLEAIDEYNYGYYYEEIKDKDIRVISINWYDTSRKLIESKDLQYQGEKLEVFTEVKSIITLFLETIMRKKLTSKK